MEAAMNDGKPKKKKGMTVDEHANALAARMMTGTPYEPGKVIRMGSKAPF